MNLQSAVYVQHALMHMTHLQFVNCSSWEGVVTLSDCSAQWSADNLNKTAIIDSCSFVKCSAPFGVLQAGRHMGAQSPVEPSIQKLSLLNSSFSGNTGAALTMYGVDHLTIQGCLFDGNIATTGLGAAYVHQTRVLTVNNSCFVANNGFRPSYSVETLDVAECAGVYAFACGSVGVVNSYFENNVGIGLAIHGPGSTASFEPAQTYEADDLSAYKLFAIDAIPDPDPLGDFHGFVGEFHSQELSVDIRVSSFSGNYAASLLRTSEGEVSFAPGGGELTSFVVGGAALDIQDVRLSVVREITLCLEA